MLTFSDDLILGMGFRALEQGESIEARFHLLRLYAIEGYTLDQETTVQAKGEVQGIPYALAVGDSVNAISRALIGDDWTPDEDAWKNERKVKPPFLLLQISSGTTHLLSTGRAKFEGTRITTIDSFPAAREELRSREEIALPPVLSSLSSIFSSRQHYVRFRELDRMLRGITAAGDVVHDLRFSGNAHMYFSKRLSPEEWGLKLQQVTETAAAIPAKVARVFRLGLEEEDLFKRFFFLFLAVEIQTHSTFKAMKKADGRSRGMRQQRDVLRTLAGRFDWCAQAVWRGLTVEARHDFRKLKKVRDDIAHGTVTEPSAASVRAVEYLAGELQVSRPAPGFTVHPQLTRWTWLRKWLRWWP